MANSNLGRKKQNNESTTEKRMQIVRKHRMTFANQAMQHVRTLIPQGPANVHRKVQSMEKERFDEYHTVDKTRDILKNKIIPYTATDGNDNPGIYGPIAAAATIKRMGKCMEMSSMAASFLGSKAQEIKQQLQNTQLSKTQQDDYEAQLQALSEVSLVEGKEENNPNKKHMWVRMGRRNSVGSVVVDAWGKGNAVRRDKFQGLKLFPDIVDKPLHGNELIRLSNTDKEVTSNTENFYNPMKSLTHDVKHDPNQGTPRMAQHDNEILPTLSRPKLPPRGRKTRKKFGPQGNILGPRPPRPAPPQITGGDPTGQTLSRPTVQRRARTRRPAIDFTKLAQ